MAEFLKKNRNTISWIMLGGGLLIFLVGLLADAIGLGTSPAGFGPKQIDAVMIGVVILCVAYYLGNS